MLIWVIFKVVVYKMFDRIDVFRNSLIFYYKDEFVGFRVPITTHDHSLYIVGIECNHDTQRRLPTLHDILVRSEFNPYQSTEAQRCEVRHTIEVTFEISFPLFSNARSPINPPRSALQNIIGNLDNLIHRNTDSGSTVPTPISSFVDYNLLDMEKNERLDTRSTLYLIPFNFFTKSVEWNPYSMDQKVYSDVIRRYYGNIQTAKS